MTFQQERILNMMQQMPQHQGETYDEVVAQVDFQLSTHPDPRKQRRQNIKRALKALKPTKRSWFSPRRYWFRGKFVYNRPHQCCVDGTNCINQDYGDLFDQYFRDPHTMKVRRYRAWTGVHHGQGRQLESTYCPQHMMLYHKLNEWVEQEEAEADPGFFQKLAKRGVALVPVKRGPKKEEHPLIVKYTPVFLEMQKDGIPMMHFTSPGCPNCGHGKGQQDLTIPIFDNRVLQATMPADNTLSSTMDMAKYHQVVEQMGKQ
jgi:hypothetical protein